MQVIDLNQAAPKRLTCLIYGATRSGKTEFAGTWPRPLFLSDAVEGGYETLRYMSPEKLWEPTHKPQVWSIESVADLLQSVGKIREQLQKSPGTIKTVVVDSLTFLSDLLEDTMLVNMASQLDKNRWALFSELKNKLRHLMIEIHKLPVNVVWICLAKEPEDGKPGGLLLTGQTGNKAPAACNLLFYQHVSQPNPKVPAIYETRTRRYGAFPAGGRMGDMLPDPLPESTYRSIFEALGLDKNVEKSSNGHGEITRRIVTTTKTGSVTVRR